MTSALKSPTTSYPVHRIEQHSIWRPLESLFSSPSDCKNPSMDMQGASMTFQAGARVPSVQGPYMNQYVNNSETKLQSPENLLSESGGLSEPPAKRLRITHNTFDKIPTPIGLDGVSQAAPHAHPVASEGSHLAYHSERLYTGGSSSTPNESTTSTDLTSSFEPKTSASPPPAPLQSIPTQDIVFGPNVLESGKVCLLYTSPSPRD